RLVPGVMRALTVCDGIAVAQESSPARPAGSMQAAPAGKPDQTRSRRVAPAAEKSTTEKKVEKDAVQARRQEPDSQTEVDPAVKVLRDQIAAATPEEKPTLQMQLVDQLIKAGMKSE